MNLLIIVYALVFGFAFGWILQRAGLTRYEKIVNVYRFTDLTVLKFMLTAIASGVIFVRLFVDFGWLDPVLINPTYITGNLVGGLLFGIGMAGAGLCPGTTVAGAGRGSLDYLVPGFLGFLTGAVLYGITYPYFFPMISKQLEFGNITIPDVLDVNPWLFVLFTFLAVVLLLYVIEKLDLRRLDKVKGETKKSTDAEAYTKTEAASASSK